MLCPKCNKNNLDTNTRCYFCNTPLVQTTPQYVQQTQNYRQIQPQYGVPTAQLSANNKKICPRCGKKLPVTARKCYNCKTVFLVHCPVCGQIIPTSEYKCKKCNTYYIQEINYIIPDPPQQEIDSYPLTQDNYYTILVNCWDNYYSKNLSDYNYTINDLKFYHQFNTDLIHSIVYEFNPRPSKPMSPTSSAIVGSAIGGTALGVAAGLEAMNKEQKYQQDYDRYIQRKVDLESAKANVEPSYEHLLSKIERNEKAKAVYDEEKRRFIIEKIKENKLAFYKSQLNAPKYSDPKKESDGCIVVIIILIFLGVLFGMVITHI